jgi:hypothetical protein
VDYILEESGVRSQESGVRRKKGEKKEKGRRILLFR